MKEKVQAKLRDWGNAAEVGTRFPISQFRCPQCDELALRDEWPPNYFASSGQMGSDGGLDETSATIKCVCVPCQIHFKVSFYRKTRYAQGSVETLERSETPFNIVPLEARNGLLLTPHDLRREDYKAEHGQYPVEVYG